MSMDKVRVIKQSVGCQWLGVWSLVPVIGVGFAIAARRRFRHVRAAVGDEWNPAQPQLKRGAVFAWVGLLINFVVVAAVTRHLWLESVAGYAERLINPLLDLLP